MLSISAETVHIMRKVAAVAGKPVLLYSIGKDNSVMPHLAMKAFQPVRPPSPLPHVDTTWTFRRFTRSAGV
jgi:sulfate adenylyltransferase subunit 2